MEYAKVAFFLETKPKGSQRSNRQNLEQLRERGIPVPELIAFEKKPRCLYYLWIWFCELHGGEFLTFAEIKAWSDLKRISLTEFEIDILKQLNHLALSHV